MQGSTNVHALFFSCPFLEKEIAGKCLEGLGALGKIVNFYMGTQNGKKGIVANHPDFIRTVPIFCPDGVPI